MSEKLDSTPETPLPRIGFLGPGAMGKGMVSRLLRAGFEVGVYARNPEKAAGLRDAGAVVSSDAGQVVDGSDIVLGCLLDSTVIGELYCGPGGIIERARPGQVFVEHATFDPALAARMAQELTARGASFLDAPVSGGPAGAMTGTLVTMVGGDPGVLEMVSPVVGSYCSIIKHAGAVGSGLRLKLINQLLVSAHAVAAAEASALVLRAGIDPATAHEALMGGWAASTMLDLQLPKACAADYSSTGAAVGGLVEVQRLIADMAEQYGFDSALLGPVRRVFDATVQRGLGNGGLAALADCYAEPGTGTENTHGNEARA